MFRFGSEPARPGLGAALAVSPGIYLQSWSSLSLITEPGISPVFGRCTIQAEVVDGGLAN